MTTNDFQSDQHCIVLDQLKRHCFPKEIGPLVTQYLVSRPDKPHRIAAQKVIGGTNCYYVVDDTDIQRFSSATSLQEASWQFKMGHFDMAIICDDVFYTAVEVQSAINRNDTFAIVERTRLDVAPLQKFHMASFELPYELKCSGFVTADHYSVTMYVDGAIFRSSDPFKPLFVHLVRPGSTILNIFSDLSCFMFVTFHESVLLLDEYSPTGEWIRQTQIKSPTKYYLDITVSMDIDRGRLLVLSLISGQLFIINVKTQCVSVTETASNRIHSAFFGWDKEYVAIHHQPALSTSVDQSLISFYSLS